LPIENVLDVEETHMLNFADTCKIRVIDNDETFAMDEVWLPEPHNPALMLTSPGSTISRSSVTPGKRSTSSKLSSRTLRRASRTLATRLNRAPKGPAQVEVGSKLPTCPVLVPEKSPKGSGRRYRRFRQCADAPPVPDKARTGPAQAPAQASTASARSQGEAWT
jgi:sterol 3beta-glucosyltransferase